MNQRPVPRRQWCGALAKLVSPTFPNDATQALVDMLPAFRHMPDSLFNEETLIEVAQAKRRQAIPAFDEIIAVLNAYRRNYVHEPRPALEAPPQTQRGPTEEMKDAISSLARQAIAGMRVACAERDRIAAQQPFSVIRPLPDVTLKGEALRKSREARGLKLPPEVA